MSARLQEAGIWPKHDRIGTQRLPCPECDKGPKDDALALTIEHTGGAVWLCHRCGFSGGMAGKRITVSRDRAPPVSKFDIPKKWDAVLQRAWDECRSIEPGSAAATYLRSRGCVLPPAGSDLRWSISIFHAPTRQAFPALVAVVTDAITGEPLTLHRTYLAKDGSGKAPVEKQKLLAGGYRKKGGCVRLWPDESITTSLGLTEGIESALAAGHVFQPVWAAIDASNLSAFPTLGGIQALTIFADNDSAGLEAARQCATRWLDHDREVRVWHSQTPGFDVADEVSA